MGNWNTYLHPHGGTLKVTGEGVGTHHHGEINSRPLHGGFPMTPEAIYGRDLNEEWPYVVYDGIGRGRHG